MNHKTTTPRLPDIAGKIYDLLEPLDSSARVKVLQGVLGMLGDGSAESVSGAGSGSINKPLPNVAGLAIASTSMFAAGAKAQAWLRKHSLSDEMLERVFHVVGGQIELIANPPGTTMREQTINTYLLLGVQHLLQSDDARFADAAAVALCKRLGCYDTANHSMTRTRFGNKLTGSKETGYALTMPGLDQAATLIKAAAS